jgi:Uma2 family endonuclease
MIRSSELPSDLVTVDEFRTLVADGQKADLIDGVIYMASPDTRRNNDINMWLVGLLRNYIAAKGIGGSVFASRYAFELSEIRAPEPDVAYIRSERLHLAEQRGMKGGPDIAVEIVSRDSRTRDYVEKKQLYLEAGVPEYWIIDTLARRCEFLALADGRYEPMPLESNRIFKSRALPGFWLDIEWLLSEPLANDYECLQAILEAH